MDITALAVYVVIFTGVFFPVILAMILDRKFGVMLYLWGQWGLTMWIFGKLAKLGDNTTAAALFLITWFVTLVVVALAPRTEYDEEK